MELLKSLYSIHAKSGHEERIQKYIVSILETIPNAEVSTDDAGNVYAVKHGNIPPVKNAASHQSKMQHPTSQKTHIPPVKKPEEDAVCYPCIVAHMDQVQTIHSRDFTVGEKDGMLYGYSPTSQKLEGLGADDKNGVWCALQLFKTLERVKCAFFVGEEIGCVGSGHADMSFFKDCGYILQADRRGNRDLITNICGAICSQEFIDTIQPEKFGYVPTHGMMTDVETLRDNGVGVCCANISCGYYDPHTDHEYTSIADLENCLAFMQHIVNTCGCRRFEFARDNDWWDDWYYGYPHQSKNSQTIPTSQKTYGWDYEEQYWEAMEEMDAIFSDNPNTKFEDIYDYMASYYDMLSYEDLLDMYQLYKPGKEEF